MNQILVPREAIRAYAKVVLGFEERLGPAEYDDCRGQIVAELAEAVPVDPVGQRVFVDRIRRCGERHVRHRDHIYALAYRGDRREGVTQVITVPLERLRYRITHNALRKYCERVREIPWPGDDLPSVVDRELRADVWADLLIAEPFDLIGERAFGRTAVHPEQQHLVIEDRIYAVWRGTVVKTLLFKDEVMDRLLDSVEESASLHRHRHIRPERGHRTA